MSQLRAVQHPARITERRLSPRTVGMIAGASLIAAVALAALVSNNEPQASSTVTTGGWAQEEFIRVNTIAIPALVPIEAALGGDNDAFLEWNTTALEYATPQYTEPVRGPR